MVKISGKVAICIHIYHRNNNTILILAYTGGFIIDKGLPIRIGYVKYSEEVLFEERLFWYVLKPIQAYLCCDDFSCVDVADNVSDTGSIRAAYLEVVIAGRLWACFLIEVFATLMKSGLEERIVSIASSISLPEW